MTDPTDDTRGYVHPKEERLSLCVALRCWQERLSHFPELLATPEGHAEWERVARLIAYYQDPQ